ncbi:Apoptotic chromatin condensation inducer in the nucleus [Linnemannia gamsii]|uniref:Apoptotic chromatin condensation inducer in the nucleus n=1 Tax=Linnemannia gamsii TaxID=64522 RepID=A0ABQ7JNK8_9FUNG|nr:Apoptotic chromatin condensation inducer in the nucleus [Linnemannia gamsii]
MIDANSLKVTELKAELTARGLSTKGVKKDLVTRLEEAMATDGTVTGSVTEPDVAPKDTDMDSTKNDNKDDNASTSEQGTPTTQQEAKEIAQITPPVAEPVAAPAEADIVMASAPVPAPASATKPAFSIEGIQASTAATITPDPAAVTSTLSQEGLIDTTMSNAPPAQTESKKRSLETDDTTSFSGSSNEGSSSGTKEAPAKKHKAIAINRDGNEQIIAAAKESLEADARRRSAAPSPSPAPSAHPGRTLSTSTIATVAEVATPPAGATDSETADSITTGSPLGPRSPSEDKRVGGNERRDVRSQFQRSIQLAAQDRQTEATSKSASASPTTGAAIVLPESASAQAPVEDLNPTAKRALTITNFVRPLVISQVKRMLSEYGEIETLWLDSIKTHCYVIFKETAEAENAYNATNNVVFPQETGKPLKPHFITAEAARDSIAAAELAQKAGKKPVIYTGMEPIAPATAPAAERTRAEPKAKTPIVVQRVSAGVIFKRPQVQVVQPTELFNMTKAKPMLYYKAVKEPPAPDASMETDAPTSQVAEAH